MTQDLSAGKANRNITGLKTAGAVWEFTTGDGALFLDRLGLIIDGADAFRQAGVTPQFVLLLRGPVMKFVVRDVRATSFRDDPIERGEEIRSRLQHFVEGGGRVEVCGISMQRRGVSADNLLPFCEVERNVFVSSIALQNRGYALMQVE